MTVEFIGFINTREFSEIHPQKGAVMDLAYIETVAKAHEYAGFDRALVGVPFHQPGKPDDRPARAVGHAAARHDDRASARLHRADRSPRASSPRSTSSAAAASRCISSPAAMTPSCARTATSSTKDERYARTDEYLEIMRREWTSDEPFDYDGKYYQVERGFSAVKPVQQPHIPVYFGGASDAAIAGRRQACRHLCAVGRIPCAGARAHRRASAPQPRGTAARCASACRCARSSPTPKRRPGSADEILERARALHGQDRLQRAGEPAERRLAPPARAAAQGARLDKRLWTDMAALHRCQEQFHRRWSARREQVADVLRRLLRSRHQPPS